MQYFFIIRHKVKKDLKIQWCFFSFSLNFEFLFAAKWKKWGFLFLIFAWFLIVVSYFDSCQFFANLKSFVLKTCYKLLASENLLLANYLHMTSPSFVNFFMYVYSKLFFTYNDTGWKRHVFVRNMCMYFMVITSFLFFILQGEKELVFLRTVSDKRYCK